MGIFNNFDNIIDLFTNSSSGDMEAISNNVGIEKNKTGAIIGMALPMILEAMSKNNQKPGGLESFEKAIQDHAQGPDYNSVSEYVEKADTQDGDKMLGHVFEDKGSIIDRIADTIGVEPAAVKRVLILLAPLVLKHIAGNAKNKQLDKDGVQKETDVIRDQVNDTFNNPQNAPQTSGGNMFDDILGGFLGETAQAPEQPQTTQNSAPSQTIPTPEQPQAPQGQTVNPSQPQSQSGGGLLDLLKSIFKG